MFDVQLYARVDFYDRPAIGWKVECEGSCAGYGRFNFRMSGVPMADTDPKLSGGDAAHAEDELTLEQPEEGAVVPPSTRSKVSAAVDQFLTKLFLLFLRVGREMRWFSRRMEEEEIVQPEIGTAGAVSAQETRGKVTCEPGEGPLEACGRLSDFLRKLGVVRIVFDADLESNQILDLLYLMWAVRHELSGERTGIVDRVLERDVVAEALLSDEGIHISCMNVHFDADNGRLRVKNSYCTLTFSRAATAYMHKISRFPDHRAFFRAAPRYGLFGAVLVLLPVLLAMIFGLSTGVIISAGVISVSLGAGIMIVFETIGAVQYDKEYQAKEIRRRHRALMKAHEQIETDLHRAAKIQRKLVPGDSEEPFPGAIRLEHDFAPQMEVGGDYYDFKQLDDHCLALIFADVSGHGMAGAFVTGIIKTVFEVALKDPRPPGEFMRELNVLLERLTPEDSYAAVVFAVYDVESRRLRYTNAGHQPVPMVVSCADGQVRGTDAGTGPVIGFTPDGSFEEMEIRLEPGDRFVLCTDGVTETFDEEGELFGNQRLHDLVARTAGRPVEEVPRCVMRAVEDHCGRAPQTDDRAVLVMEIVG